MGIAINASKQEALYYCLDMLDQLAEMLATHADEASFAKRVRELSDERRLNLNPNGAELDASSASET